MIRFTENIIENKKTYLYLKAIENANPNDRTALIQLFATQPESSASKIEIVKE